MKIINPKPKTESFAHFPDFPNCRDITQKSITLQQLIENSQMSLKLYPKKQTNKLSYNYKPS